MVVAARPGVSTESLPPPLRTREPGGRNGIISFICREYEADCVVMEIGQGEIISIHQVNDR